jgi:DNA-binding transcriptional regulator YdaS (Cro superfamily)
MTEDDEYATSGHVTPQELRKNFDNFWKMK